MKGCVLAAAVALPWMIGFLAPAYGEAGNPNGVAVIIGNKEYEDELIPDVSFADRDAVAFRQYVIDVLGYAPERSSKNTTRTAAPWSGYSAPRAATSGGCGAS